MEQKTEVPKIGCVSNVYVGTDEEQQRQQQHDEESDANESRHADSTDGGLITLAIRARSPTETDDTVKLRTANSNALRSNSEAKVSPPTANEETDEISQIRGEKSEQEQPTTLGKRKRSPSPEPSSKLELFNPLEGEFNAWQLGESADEFVQRLLPSITSTSICTSIWAANPHRNPRNKSPCPRVDYFKACGMRLLEQSLDNRRKIQDSSSTLPKGVLAKKLIQEGKSLRERIIKLARDTYVHAGKWMLVVKSEDVDRVWKQIVVGVIENRLGCSCEVVTDEGEGEHLVYIYTKDFQDTKDILRVLLELERMGLIPTDKALYYKSDAYTYLNLERRNAAKYALHSALYDSRTILSVKDVSKSEFRKEFELDKYLRSSNS